MSLATSAGGGLGGGGGAVTMAQNAHAMARPTAPQPPPRTSGIPTGPTAAPPSMAALGADLLDKSQSLSQKQVRNLSRFPLVAVDLFGSQPHVAMFPPKPKDPSTQLVPVIVGKIKSHVSLKKSEVAHKTLRKYLMKSKGYASLQKDAIDPQAGVVIECPHQWLGARRVTDAPEFIQNSFTIVNDSSNHAIAEESATAVGVTVANGTLDGTSAPKGDDFDRVVYKVRLDKSKKALAVLPEEAVSLVLCLAKHHVSRKAAKTSDNEEEVLEYPVAIPLPAWACHDAAMEALLDATDGCGVVFQRSLAALAGALVPGYEGHPNAVLERINLVRTSKQKEHQKEHPDADQSSFEYDSLVVLVGLTGDGIECTAVQVTSLQASSVSAVFGNYKVLTNVSYPHEDPLSQVDTCVKEIYSNLEDIAPEADGPVGFITYGTVDEQGKVKSSLNTVKTELETWEKIPVFSTRAECVSMGTAILGAVSHGRIMTFTHVGDKPKPQLAIRVQNVAPTAVGVRMNYHGGAKNAWTPVKTIFDFDRRVPAGPYPLELKATECAALRNARSTLSDEELLKASKQFEGSGGISEREKAALAFRLQIVQQCQRTGKWLNVGDAMSPLTKTEGDEDDETKVACESVTLELSLRPTGIIATALVGERESVVQATKSARNSKLRYYVGILLAILFFGGFLVKSFMEERIFERDTKRVLAYYKHVIPGSMNDGDEHHARYIVWKYRGRKDKLWKSLESKYGVPVKHEWEWEDEEEEATEEEDVENLDEASEQADDKEKTEGTPDL